LAEAQSKLIAELLGGRYELPQPTERKQRSERERATMFARYVPSRRHTMQVDYDEYLTSLTDETEAGRTRARHRAARARDLASQGAKS